ncbi:class I SAM-dependent methyltransferase [Caldimonas thermodepolymerans]|uniref:23S rRNA (Cytosine(1962)-C(5))-methyltransferase RlmI n=1 Tax=Caldimonas thermodepolymerans TaxID=215580 RepID=A0A2S5T5W9_9BURK|nr:class I SAM-dependent methyltransferase [Caldimonas thermodepolymerans]PPE70257.1 23S rRNA (cytosine(1962)-C(5))-methyltransferase RlmI [Caldimonas thermodepolymerans]QPC32251.1 class I SAM-dependent methyltransferase [Caldimonas thermodepolymerans]RDH98142.1 23S rRNA (cytosine1962-C5)-methyltransferase [Caldimonas thermodepolymerans]TCP08083.1 23S rRNA (cytosine1962-C5)-methyltransferase [Caldimonas thermodepolymerans]UZG48795.1 class I SAM-dependent methyltransferase [Caldimonas thermodep
MKVITLREGKERSLLRRHPWVFQGSIARGKADAGETVRVQAHDGRFLAWAAYSPTSMIRVRAWSFDEAERIDEAFFARRIEQAVAVRRRLPIASDAVRLIHGEADGLPGLIVDRYGDTLSAQFLSAGTERWKQTIADLLLQATGLQRLYERSDSGVRTLEGLPAATGWLRGSGATELTIREHEWQLTLDVAEGHKTGFYLDQRDNRKLFADTVRHFGCRRVLNCYCYTGGFSIAALAGGAEQVVSVDSSAPALARASAHVALNGFDAGRHEALDADVNDTLRRYLKEGRRFDAIVLDPPKFAPTASHAERAARAYKDINRLAFKLLEPGGLLFTFSCSGGIGAELFHKIVAGAGLDAGVDGFIQARLGAAPDHPMTITFPEGEYLKGLVVLKRAG